MADAVNNLAIISKFLPDTKVLLLPVFSSLGAHANWEYCDDPSKLRKLPQRMDVGGRRGIWTHVG